MVHLRPEVKHEADDPGTDHEERRDSHEHGAYFQHRYRVLLRPVRVVVVVLIFGILTLVCASRWVRHPR